MSVSQIVTVLPLTCSLAVIGPQGIFGVPLQQSIRYANVAISLFNDEGQSYIYGYVPIVVAKCGVFLKEKGESTVIHAPCIRASDLAL